MLLKENIIYLPLIFGYKRKKRELNIITIHDIRWITVNNQIKMNQNTLVKFIYISAVIFKIKIKNMHSIKFQ